MRKRVDPGFDGDWMWTSRAFGGVKLVDLGCGSLERVKRVLGCLLGSVQLDGHAFRGG